MGPVESSGSIWGHGEVESGGQEYSVIVVCRFVPGLSGAAMLLPGARVEAASRRGAPPLSLPTLPFMDAVLPFMDAGLLFSEAMLPVLMGCW
eukprot:1390009-Rhodomonas_salina.1